MSTIPAEGEAAPAAPKHWARMDNPPMVWLAGILGTVYILAIRWAIKDKSLAKKMEAMEAEKAASHAVSSLFCAAIRRETVLLARAARKL
jgi:hypothetical protein